MKYFFIDSLDVQMSTIAQFRVLDFGMENCSLVVTVPPRNKSNAILSGPLDGTALLDVWALSVERKLKMHKLSWATRPQSRTFLGSHPISFNATHKLPSFSCSSGTYQTFEFSCSVPECHIDLLGVGTQASG